MGCRERFVVLAASGAALVFGRGGPAAGADGADIAGVVSQHRDS